MPSVARVTTNPLIRWTETRMGEAHVTVSTPAKEHHLWAGSGHPRDIQRASENATEICQIGQNLHKSEGECSVTSAKRFDDLKRIHTFQDVTVPALRHLSYSGHKMSISKCGTQELPLGYGPSFLNPGYARQNRIRWTCTKKRNTRAYRDQIQEREHFVNLGRKGKGSSSWFRRGDLLTCNRGDARNRFANASRPTSSEGLFGSNGISSGFELASCKGEHSVGGATRALDPATLSTTCVVQFCVGTRTRQRCNYGKHRVAVVI